MAAVQPSLANIDRRSRQLVPVFHNSHRKCQLSPPAVALTFEYFEGVSSKAVSRWSEKKQVRFHIISLEWNNQVTPK